MQWWVAGLGLLAGGAAAAGWFLMRRRDDEVVRHTLRLASEIVAVGATIDADLARVPAEAPFQSFAQRCRENAERAHEALKQGRALRQMDPELLSDTALLLYEDHRRTVDLRSEVDRALAKWLETHGGDAPRIFKFARTRPSGWASSSFHTRPSTFP
jgi:hypothetical protein